MSATAFVPDPTLRDRLTSQTARVESGCLLWTGLTGERGYGLIKNGPKRQRRMVTTHRAAFALFVRPLVDGEHVLHRCDTPACIEPTHLFAGDHAANMRDMISKGRRVNEVTPEQTGSRNSQTHLSEDDVRTIRARRAGGSMLREIGAEFGISKATVSEICSRRTWQHVA